MRDDERGCFNLIKPLPSPQLKLIFNRAATNVTQTSASCTCVPVSYLRIIIPCLQPFPNPLPPFSMPFSSTERNYRDKLNLLTIQQKALPVP